MTRAALAAPLAALAVLAAPARANQFDIYGFQPRAVAMGSAMTAAADDYTGTYYNPGALTRAKQVRLGASFNLTLPAVYVERQVDDPDTPTTLPPRQGGFTLGWVYPFGGVFRDRLALGLSLHVSSGRIARVESIDRQAPHFYMYQSLHDKLLFHGAVAVEPVDWLSFGVGVAILADLTGRAVLGVDILDGRFARREFSVELQPNAALVAGVHVRPAPDLSLGLTWRGSSSVRFELPVEVAEGDAFRLAIDVAQTVLWSPDQLALGVAYRLPDPGLTLAFDAVLALWSRAPDPSTQLRGDIGGRLLDGLGLGDALDLSLESDPIDPGFVNTVITHAGFEWETLPWLRLRAGYGFRPTPVPRQTGATAYLDNDAHVVSLGAGFEFADPLRVHVHPVSVDVAAAVTVLPRQTVVRGEPGDPVGAMSHGGALWTFTAGVRHAY